MNCTHGLLFCMLCCRRGLAVLQRAEATCNVDEKNFTSGLMYSMIAVSQIGPFRWSEFKRFNWLIVEVFGTRHRKEV
jgi:hypothetical protein